jgi:hypothetical protein
VAGLNVRDGTAFPLFNGPLLVSAAMLLALAVVTRPAREWLPFATGANIVHLVSGIVTGGTTPIVTTQLVNASFTLWALLTSLAAIRSALDASARGRARAAARAELDALRDSTAAIRRDRLRRLRLLEDGAFPLLSGIAAGDLDPLSDEVRQASARQAAVLRRTLSEPSGSSGGLGQLETVVHDAETRGIHVTVQLAANIADLPPVLAADLAHLLDTALRSVRSGPVMVTVLAEGESGSIFVSFPGEPDLSGIPDRPAAGSDYGSNLTITKEQADDGTVVEVRWQRTPAIDPFPATQAPDTHAHGTTPRGRTS